MTDLEDSIKVQDIDHCGIVAGIIDRIGLVDIINEKLGTHPLQSISPGISVKAMILNGLGFVSKPLYLLSKFFEDDAKLVAAMLVHGLTHILTFDISDFARYSEITAVNPREIVS